MVYIQLKCSNPTCDKSNPYELLVCDSCTDNAFQRYYSMVTATWYALQCMDDERSDSDDSLALLVVGL